MWGRGLAALGLLSAAVLPVQPAAAQNVLGGALLGGAAGAIVGGAVTGRGGGAAVGAAIGAATGAMIASQGERRRDGYYAWRRGCYVQRRDGAWIRVSPRYCGPVETYAPAPRPRVYELPPQQAWCARHYRSYDPASQTFLGLDGRRHPCP